MKLRASSPVGVPLDRPEWQNYGFAALMLAASLAGRWFLDPWARDAIPLATLYIGVAFTVWYAGWKPAAAVAAVGYVVALWWFLPPRYTFKLWGELGTLRAALYSISCIIVIFICESLRRARKRHVISEAKVRSILENMHECFCSVDAEWRIVSVNRSAETCLQRSREQVQSRPLWEAIPTAVGTALERQLRRARTENTVVQFETDAIAQGRWHAVTASPVGSELSIFFQDITGSRAHLNELERLVDDRTAALQRIVVDLETFSYTLVHDMRAPLRSISGFAEILAADHAGKLDVEGQRHLARIQKSATRMDQLITDILAYSQLSRNQPELRSIRLDETLREILRSHSEFQSEQADIEIEPPLPVVRGNDALLTQCFFNLLHNATKFVAPGVKPRIRIASTTVGNLARVEVVDNGIGISPEAIARIFEPFQREHASYEGTGIGLAIVRKAAEQLGGRAGVQSRPGEGSRFWVELPLAKTLASPLAADTRVLV